MMRNIFIALIILILMVEPCFADFRFAVIGDSRADNEEGINIKVFGAILDRIKSESVEFILVTGDMMTGSKHKDINITRLKKWKDIVETYGLRSYVIPGNHEIWSEESENIVRSIFEMPENGPANLKELVYSFDYENAHFVALDTSIYHNFHSLGTGQLEWLKEDLKKNDKKIIFIFGHFPAYPIGHHRGDSLDKYPSQRDEVWNVFKEYGVGIYFCGHEHLYNRSIHNGIYQVITAGAGARLHTDSQKGGFYHFVIVDVKDSLCEVTVKDINGFVKDTFKIQF